MDGNLSISGFSPIIFLSYFFFAFVQKDESLKRSRFVTYINRFGHLEEQTYYYLKFECVSPPIQFKSNIHSLFGSRENISLFRIMMPFQFRTCDEVHAGSRPLFFHRCPLNSLSLPLIIAALKFHKIVDAF